MLTAAVAATAFVAGGPAESASPQEEVRALWVLRTSLVSPQSIATMVRTASAHGFNTLFVQVRGRGDAFYTGGAEPRAQQLASQASSFDPLAETIRHAGPAGLRVHAWINTNLVSSATYLPMSRSHVVHRHPEWLMVPRSLAAELTSVDPQSPAYIGKLARWTRSQNGVEGLYASPIHPGYAAHVEALVADLVARYPLDGVHLDYVRFPNPDFDYSRHAVAEFRTEVAPELAAEERERLDRQTRGNPGAYADAFPERWGHFRRSRLSALVMRVRTAVKTQRPNAMLTAAVAPDYGDAYSIRLQDWRTWLENGIVDVACPMAYTADAAVFGRQIAAARDIAGGARIWAGIGAYQMKPAQTVNHIRTARGLGLSGIALFSYDSLTDAAQNRTDYLALVGREAFSAPRAAGAGAR